MCREVLQGYNRVAIVSMSYKLHAHRIEKAFWEFFFNKEKSICWERITELWTKTLL